MNRNISLWQAMGFGVAVLGGTLLHFIYGWTGGIPLAAIFSAVNESTWEHMKLFFIPAFIFALVQRGFFPERRDFWCVKLVGIVAGLLLIPILFYTYNGAFGKSPDWLNIGIFIISAAAAFLLENRLFRNNSLYCSSPAAAFALLILLAASFAFFTFSPPPLPLFMPPYI